jgi:hypothetical protein
MTRQRIRKCRIKKFKELIKHETDFAPCNRDAVYRVNGNGETAINDHLTREIC